MPEVPITQMYQTEAQAAAGLLRYKAVGRWLETALDWLFPPRCAGCGRVDTVWCSRCQAEIAQEPPQLALRTLPSLTACAAGGLHDGKLRSAIHALKYERALTVADPLAERLAQCLAQMDWQVDLIVPVPLHSQRLRLRGYNQAEVLARSLSRMVDIPCRVDVITRVRETRSQVGLDAVERRQNVVDAFAPVGDVLPDLSVLLVDDVYTTGATMDACANALLRAGARAVYALTVATARA